MLCQPPFRFFRFGGKKMPAIVVLVAEDEEVVRLVIAETLRDV